MFVLSAAILFQFFPVLINYISYTFATGVYTNATGDTRFGLLAILWTLVCWMIVQLAHYAWSLFTPGRWVVLKEFLIVAVNLTACVLVAVAFVRYNVADNTADLTATLVAQLTSG